MNESVRCLPPRVTLRWRRNRGGILQSIVMPDASARRSAHRRHSWSGQDGAERLQVGVDPAAGSRAGSACAVGTGGRWRAERSGPVAAAGFSSSRDRRFRSGAGRETGDGRRAVADCPRLGSVDRLRCRYLCPLAARPARSRPPRAFSAQRNKRFFLSAVTALDYKFEVLRDTDLDFSYLLLIS